MLATLIRQAVQSCMRGRNTETYRSRGDAQHVVVNIGVHSVD